MNGQHKRRIDIVLEDDFAGSAACLGLAFCDLGIRVGVKVVGRIEPMLSL